MPMGRICPWACLLICEFKPGAIIRQEYFLTLALYLKSFGCLLHVGFVLGDHLLYHLTANRTGLLRGQVTVVTLLKVYTNLPWCSSPILKWLYLLAYITVFP